MFLKSTKDGVPAKQIMESLSYSVNLQHSWALYQTCWCPFQCLNHKNHLYLPIFLFPDLYLPALMSLILRLLTLLTGIHNKNISFSGKEKSFGVAADWNISDFPILIIFITGILNFLLQNPRNLGIFSRNLSPYLISLVYDVFGVENWDVSSIKREITGSQTG